MASDIQRNRVAVVSTAQTSWRAAWSEAQHTDLIDGRSISNGGFLGATPRWSLIRCRTRRP